MGKSTISMVIFNSYFDTTRGYPHLSPKTYELRSLPVLVVLAGVKWPPLCCPGTCSRGNLPWNLPWKSLGSLPWCCLKMRNAPHDGHFNREMMINRQILGRTIFRSKQLDTYWNNISSVEKPYYSCSVVGQILWEALVKNMYTHFVSI